MANLSIKNVPDDWVERLRRRASRHHRSLQGELMTILEATVGEEVRMRPDEVLARAREIGVSTSDESAAMVREDRERG